MKVLCFFSIILFLVYIFDVFKTEPNPVNAIFDIARKGTVVQLEEYLMEYKTIDIVNTSGYTPLILACYHGNTSVAKVLAESTKDINYQKDYGAALHAASYKNHTEIVKILLQHQAKPNIADEQGDTALIYAVKNRNPEMVSLLLKYGADKTYLDSRGNDAMQYALKLEDVEIIELLK